MFHLAWEYMDPHDHETLCQAAHAMIPYARLRRRAFFTTPAELESLRAPRPKPDDSPIDTQRAHLMAVALLRFNMDYGDLVKWLGGPYTNAHRDWLEFEQTLNLVKNIPPAPDDPQPDFDRALRTCTEGAPLRGHFTSSLQSCHERNLAPLSNDLQTNAAAVDEKLRSEEKLSYHIVFPRFLWRFIPGIFLCIFRLAFRWMDPKPRLCVDPSTRLSPTDTGNTNAQIPPPGEEPDENPPIYYGTAFMRYLQWIWNLRISYPKEDIIQMTDDVSAAFHRILYHPDIAPAFATVWREWLIIPIGTIFGSRSSPSTYMLLGEVRSHIANAFPNVSALDMTALAKSIHLSPEPPPEEVAKFVPAVPDSQHQGILNPDAPEPQRRMPVFVDDTGVAHIRRYFRTVANSSVAACYATFGAPEDDPLRPPAINPSKWQDYCNWILDFLGYTVDTRRMTVSWPAKKRHKLAVFLNDLLVPQRRREGSSPQAVSRILGLVRHAALVAPMGSQRSLHLQLWFNDLLSTTPGANQLRRWYQRPIVHLPEDILADLEYLLRAVSPTASPSLWERPIGLIIPRDPTITFWTDASLNGMGGWCAADQLNHKWRLSLEDFHQCGLPAGPGRWTNPQNYGSDVYPDNPHINILEFIALIIEIWICARQIHRATTDPSSSDTFANAPPGGHRLGALADNTSALSWLRYASRTKRIPVRNLARLLMAFLSHPFITALLCVQGRHLAGRDNIGADLLSRFENAPSWESATEQYPPLATLRTCLLPRELLSVIAYAVSQKPTGDWFETKAIELWTLEPPGFGTGSATLVGTTTSLSPV